MIHEMLRIKRPKKSIKEKLLELRLAQDSKEFRKKRVKKRNPGEFNFNIFVIDFCSKCKTQLNFIIKFKIQNYIPFEI